MVFPDLKNVSTSDIVEYCRDISINVDEQEVCELTGDVGDQIVIIGGTDIVIESSISVTNTTLVIKAGKVEITEDLIINNDATLQIENFGDGLIVGGCLDPSGTLLITSNASAGMKSGDNITLISYGCLEGERFASENITLPEGICSDIKYKRASLQLVFTACDAESNFPLVLVVTMTICLVVVVIVLILAFKVGWRVGFPFREDYSDVDDVILGDGNK